MIYLVEDDDNIRKLVCYALEREGYSVTGFSAPANFWTQCKSEVPSLILLDIMLPAEDGLSILSKLRADNRLKNVPVIMLTARESEFDKVTGLDMGADDYITKLFGMTELISRVRAVLRRYERTAPSLQYTIGSLSVNPEKQIVRADGELSRSPSKNIPFSWHFWRQTATLSRARHFSPQYGANFTRNRARSTFIYANSA